MAAEVGSYKKANISLLRLTTGNSRVEGLGLESSLSQGDGFQSPECAWRADIPTGRWAHVAISG